MDLIKLLDVANPKKIKDTLNILIENYENFGDHVQGIADKAAEDSAAALAAGNEAKQIAQENTESLEQSIAAQDLKLDNAIAAQDGVVSQAAEDSANAKQTAEEALAMIEQADARSQEATTLAEQAIATADEATATSELAMNVATEAKSSVDQALSTGVFGTFVHNTAGLSLLHAYMTDNVNAEDTDERFHVATPKLVRDALSGIDLSDYMDLSSAQTASGAKSFDELILNTNSWGCMGISNKALNNKTTTWMRRTLFGYNVSGSHDATVFGYNAEGTYQGTAFGSSANAKDDHSTAIGYNAYAAGYSSTAIGSLARTSAQKAIQLGQGTNSTANTLQVGTHTLLDCSTGLIPNERLDLTGALSDYMDLTTPQTVTMHKTFDDCYIYLGSRYYSDKLRIDAQFGGLYSFVLMGGGNATVGNNTFLYSNTQALAGNDAVVIGSNANYNVAWDNLPNKIVAIGYKAEAHADQAIQLGEGTNTTEKTLQVYDYPLLDGNTGKIPNERLDIALPAEYPEYDLVIKTQTDFENFYAALDNGTCTAKSVLFVGDGGTASFVRTDGKGLHLPSTLKVLTGINSAAIRITNFDGTSLAGIYYTTKPTDTNCSISNIAVTVISSSASVVCIQNCINISNCTLKAYQYSSGTATAVAYCKNISHCDILADCRANENGVLAGTSYGIYESDYAVDCTIFVEGANNTAGVEGGNFYFGCVVTVRAVSGTGRAYGYQYAQYLYGCTATIENGYIVRGFEICYYLTACASTIKVSGDYNYDYNQCSYPVTCLSLSSKASAQYSSCYYINATQDDIPTNYITTDTEQTISVNKTFTGTITVPDVSIT